MHYLVYIRYLWFEHADNENHEKNIPSVMYNIFHDGMANWLGSPDGTASTVALQVFAFHLQSADCQNEI
jgi:hypothetical protein